MTKTEKTSWDAQGNRITEVTEDIDNGNGRRERKTYHLTDGGEAQEGRSNNQNRQLRY